MTSIFKISFDTDGAPDPIAVMLLFKGENYEQARAYAIKFAKEKNWRLRRIEETWVSRSEPRWKPNQIRRVNKH